MTKYITSTRGAQGENLPPKSEIYIPAHCFFTPAAKAPRPIFQDPLLTWDPRSPYSQHDHECAAQLHHWFSIERRLHLNKVFGSQPHAFQQHRKQIDPAKLKSKAAAWLTLAVAVGEEGFDPQHFIHRIISDLSPQDFVPLPLQLAGEDYRARYRHACADALRRVKAELATGQALLAAAQRGSPGTAAIACAEALTNPDEMPGVLFRFSAAMRLQQVFGIAHRSLFVRIADMYHAQALIAYAPEKLEYDPTWGRQWITAEFAQKATTLYQALVGPGGAA